MQRQAFHMALVLTVSILWAFGQTSRPKKAPPNGGDFSHEIHPPTKVPDGVILVKGAWSSASDSTTPYLKEASSPTVFLAIPILGSATTSLQDGRKATMGHLHPTADVTCWPKSGQPRRVKDHHGGAS